MKKTLLLMTCAFIFHSSFGFAGSSLPNLSLKRHYTTSNSTYESSYNPRTEPDYTDLPAKITPLKEQAFIFSPKLQRWVAYDENGMKVAGGSANAGADFCEETNEPCHTPVGQFRITQKRGPNCVSSQFPVGESGSPMPYCMFFKRGSAIHGSPTLSTQNSSHGCIRVLTSAAEWLSKNFLTVGTRVIVLPY